MKQDLVFDEDPWARYNSPGGTNEKTVETKRRPIESRVKLHASISRSFTQANNLFHKSTFQLLQGWSGVHVVPFEDFADLDTVTTANLCACASAVLVVGAAGESISKRFPDKDDRINPCSWMASKPPCCLKARSDSNW